MKLFIRIVFVVLNVFGTLPLCAGHSSTASESLQIKSQLIPLESIEAGNGFKDLESLKSVFADACVIALGEATHGTREFSSLNIACSNFSYVKWAAAASLSKPATPNACLSTIMSSMAREIAIKS